MRGAGVEVDTRRATTIVVGVLLTAMAVLIIVLVIAGINQNSEIDRLRHHGVLVDVTVKECTGQLGGSGSNAAAYRCAGTFVLRGQHFSATIPGGRFRDAGSTVRLVTTVGDPGLVATVAQVRVERTSWGVFVAPLVLTLVVIVIATLVAVRRRQRTPAPPSGEPPA